MKERVYRILNIKFSESSQVFDLLTVQFFIGLANALVNIIAFTLFIYNFPIHSLPVVYLVIAGLLILLNIFYEWLEHRFSPLALLKYIIVFAAGLLVLLWWGVSFWDKNTFIFILLVASVLIYMITGYAFWGLVSLLFNVRESRRVFSIVGSGDIPAKLIGYIAGPLLIPFVGINNLLWLAVISLVTGFFLFSRFIRKKSWDSLKMKSHDHAHHEHHIGKRQGLVSFFFKNKLIFAISLLSVLSYNVFVLIDFTFISQVKLRFENISDLAAYIAIFFAFGRLIALTFKLIFTSRVIERLGVVSSLFITPVALFLFCLLFFLFRDHSNYNLFIFGLMAMLTEVLRSTMQEPVFFILFQPLKENLRLKGHIISKGYMYPPSLIIVGLSLLFCYNTGIELTIHLAIKVVLINLCIWAAIIFLIRRTYLNTVHASIQKGIFSSDDIYITDQRTNEILLNKINTGGKIEVIYALNLLEKSGYANFTEMLEMQLAEGKDVEVKKYALDRLEVKGNTRTTLLHDLLKQEADIELQQKVVGLLCKYDPAYLKKASENIASHDYSIRKIIVINLLNQREFNYLFRAGSEINNLLRSPDPVERELAIEIISELKHVQFSNAIETLINDPELSVKRQAINAACKLNIESLLPVVIRHLDIPTEKNIVLKGLQLYGDNLFEDMNRNPAMFSDKYVAEFVKIAGRVKGRFSTSYLISKLDTDAHLKDKVVHALWIKEYEPVNVADKESFSVLLHHYLRTSLEKVDDYAQVPLGNDADLIKRSIRNEIKYDLATSLKICSLLFRKKEINRILELMEIDNHDKLYNAMEMLELLLPKKISKDLIFLFDFILDPEHTKKLPVKREIQHFYNKVIFNEPKLYNAWTKAVCVYCSWRNHDQDIMQKLKSQAPSDEHYLVKETTAFVLNTIK
ncbi:MAG TPA: MFS transporter [Ferruginibacter sp.]|nr:MFS transporter [Ferruginibacter sp.]